MVKIIYFYVFPKMFKQSQQQSSELRVSSTLEKSPNIVHLNQLIGDLIQATQSLYDRNSLSIPTLNQIFKKILSDFSQRDDIPKVDIFAIFNSLRKMNEIPFEHDSKNWTFCFSRETSLTSEKSKMTITVESSMMFGFFRTIINRLNPIQQDLLYLMYRSILKQHNVSPKILEFELTIEKDYEYWSNFLKWKTERDTFLQCQYKFIRQRYFSRKDTRYYLNQLSRPSGYPFTIESFNEFLNRHYIYSNEHFKKIVSNWNFDPTF
jgi:hypothetical protein